MNLKNKISSLIIGFSLVFFILSKFISYNIALGHKVEEVYEENKLIFDNLLDAQVSNLEILADMLSSDGFVIEAFLKNKPEIIRTHILPIWKMVQKSKLVYEIHFFKPPAESFVNFSNFQSIGSDASSVRTDIVWVTATSFKKSTHFMMCRTYAGIRATNPIYDKNGKILGGLSLGKKIDWLPQTLKEKNNLESFLVYKKESTVSLKPKYYKEFMKDKEIIGNYILARRTLQISKQEIQNIDFSKKIQAVEINKQRYTLLLYKIVDFNKNTMAYISVLTKLEKFKEKFFEKAIKDFLIIILSVLVILIFIRYQIKKLLNHIDALGLLTLHLKKRNFKVLLSFRDEKSFSANKELYKLENNIIEMGEELEHQYLSLKNDNMVQAKQLIAQLYTDNLTDLGNRNALARDLAQDKSMYLAIFNIRGFRSINEAFGYEMGNIILKTLAKEFHQFAQQNNLISYRIGSDEFVLVSRNTINEDIFLKLIKEQTEKIEANIFRFKNNESNIDMKIVFYLGICFEKNDRIHKAEMALTKAKKERKELVVYNELQNTEGVHLHNIKILQKVDFALREDKIVVYFQPIVDRSAKIVKYEALVRLVDRDGTIVSPHQFLDISKKSKSYSKITHTVIEKSFKKFQGINSLVSINITADDMLNSDTIKLIYTKLDECEDPRSIVFELIESDDLYNIAEVSEFILSVHSRGAKIAIDDFGTGYSNFAYMMKITPDYLKIDASLIKNLDRDTNAYKIVTAIVKFAHELNIIVVAEFVHSQEIFLICKEIGIDEFQGYYFGEPKSELIS